MGVDDILAAGDAQRGAKHQELNEEVIAATKRCSAMVNLTKQALMNALYGIDPAFGTPFVETRSSEIPRGRRCTVRGNCKSQLAVLTFDGHVDCRAYMDDQAAPIEFTLRRIAQSIKPPSTAFRFVPTFNPNVPAYQVDKETLRTLLNEAARRIR